MRQVECGYEHCSERRVHWERPEVRRGIQLIDVSDDYPEDKKAYCSITCAAMDGAMPLIANVDDSDY